MTLYTVRKTSAAWIFAAWLVVAIPAGWGVYNTALNAEKLFAATHQQPQSTSK